MKIYFWEKPGMNVLRMFEPQNYEQRRRINGFRAFGCLFWLVVMLVSISFRHMILEFQIWRDKKC